MTEEYDEWFEQIWNEQKELNEDIFGKEDISNLTREEREEIAQVFISGVHEEATELNEHLGTKVHRLDIDDGSMNNAKIESVDLIKYALSLAQLMGMDYEEFQQQYEAKHKVVEDRWNKKRQRLTEDTKIVGVDIDNVLANYTESLIDWINENTELGPFEYEEHTDYKIHRCLGIPRDEYNVIKAQYRESGAIAEMPALEGAKEGMERLKEEGYTIALLTARKVEKHNRIHSDTLEWLEENEIPYDFIVFGSDKYQKLIDEVYPAEVDFFIDDKKGNAQELAYNGVEVYLMDFPYNQGETYEKVHRVNDWDNLIETLEDDYFGDAN